MKKMSLALAALCVTCAAHAEGYIQTSVGAGKIHEDCGGTTSCSDSKTGFKLIGGAKLENDLALEVQYFNYGRAKGPLDLGSVRYDAAVSVIGFGAGAAYSLPITTSLNLTGRAGLAVNRARATVSGPGYVYSSTQSKLMPYLGAEIGFDITKSTAIVLGADFSQASDTVDNVNVQLFTVGLKFGL